MKAHLRTRSFTDVIAAKTDNHEIKHAVKSGLLSILCDPKQKKFWFACCPEHLWDTVIAEIKALTDFMPLIDDAELKDEQEDFAFN